MKSWLEAARIYGDRRVIAIVLLGFSSGLPLLLVFSTLSFWLKDEGVSKTAIGLFALVRTPYTFKFLWAPLIDRLPLPLLTRRLGRRRSWALVTQGFLMLSIFGLASTSPAATPWITAALAVCVAFCSASQDVVIDAYRIELLDEQEQGAGAGAIVLGYRVGMLMAGAGALTIAEFSNWNLTYAIMGVLVLVGVATILAGPEPRAEVAGAGTRPEGGRGTGHWFHDAVIAPFADFMRRPGWLMILLFIMFYKLGDAYLGVMANPFYVEMGFSKPEIAGISKIFGFGATILGGLLGGVLVLRRGIVASLLICGVLQMLSNLVFAVQAALGHDLAMLTLTIAVENLSGGMATTAFVAYLASLCNVAYTATQYALLSSFMAFARDILSSSSGWVADQVDWVSFFLITTAAALPGLVLLLWMIRRYPASEPVAADLP